MRAQGSVNVTLWVLIRGCDSYSYLQRARATIGPSIKSRTVHHTHQNAVLPSSDEDKAAQRVIPWTFLDSFSRNLSLGISS